MKNNGEIAKRKDGKKKVYDPVISKLKKEKKKKKKLEKKKKKLKEKSKNNEIYSDKKSNNKSDSDISDELIVNFDLVDPDNIYKDNIKILLKNSELYSNIKCFEELTHIICEQQNIGKFVCISNENENENENNLISFATIINLNQYNELISLKEFFINKIEKINKNIELEENRKQIKMLLENKNLNIGLLISNRIINCPICLIPLIHKNIGEDIIWSQNIDDLDQNEKKFYFFDYILFYTKAYKNVNNNDQIIFFNFEEEHFFKHKLYYFMWNNNNIKKFYEIENEKNKEANYKEFVIVFIIPYSKYQQVSEELQNSI
ncbi:protein BCP1, putative [Plasmodium berghei]|uniref:Protein BCP1, putative n=2 Tax=Plasmodium berghei TaxID=5821 RepID=A0A509AXD5_PLABA|nr:protein BCP1, putative [Plasmodium berghei ANKA]CXI98406.1 protein BCP1, putative [Plasmodium berghei]SCL97706.1 protein BCP1, putative [Plasmodium berghei]SCM16665.1 protein BCP1, putative [Plasmodium berghei]SCM18462.1 protein BCP1, putative [Plasmodium berghei]VUC57777.1 protein BCP1, putative [Plasmodium berghei ANKA]|eukprot:XP_034423547.1 protein BCP1, putative [Plasmodium berghei ANKA]